MVPISGPGKCHHRCRKLCGKFGEQYGSLKIELRASTKGEETIKSEAVISINNLEKVIHDKSFGVFQPVTARENIIYFHRHAGFRRKRITLLSPLTSIGFSPPFPGTPSIMHRKLSRRNPSLRFWWQIGSELLNLSSSSFHGFSRRKPQSITESFEAN